MRRHVRHFVVGAANGQVGGRDGDQNAEVAQTVVLPLDHIDKAAYFKPTNFVFWDVIVGAQFGQMFQGNVQMEQESHCGIHFYSKSHPNKKPRANCIYTRRMPNLSRPLLNRGDVLYAVGRQQWPPPPIQ